jgi:hypothetical protein
VLTKLVAKPLSGADEIGKLFIKVRISGLVFFDLFKKNLMVAFKWRKLFELGILANYSFFLCMPDRRLKQKKDLGMLFF